MLKQWPKYQTYGSKGNYCWSSEYSPLKIRYFGLRGFFATVTMKELIINCLLEVNSDPFVVYFFLISVLFFWSGKIIKGTNFDKRVFEYIFMGSWLWFSRGSALMLFAHIIEWMKYTKTTASSNPVDVQFH